MILKQVDDNGVDSNSYEEAHKALTKRFAPTLNRIYQMNVLADMKQRESESMDSFHQRVKEKVDAMQLSTLTISKIIELIILAQLVNNTINVPVKRKALKDNQSLKDFLDSARTFELTEQQLKQMTEEKKSVDFIRKSNSNRNKNSNNHVRNWKSEGKKGQAEQSTVPSNCGACGYSHMRGKCPGKSQTCGKCGGKSHFARVCRNKAKPKPQDSSRAHTTQGK
jgi:predicted Zn-ribbon and HTH transcriptional regulator